MVVKYRKRLNFQIIRDNSGALSEFEGGCYEVNVENIVMINTDFANGPEYVYDSMKVNCN